MIMLRVANLKDAGFLAAARNDMAYRQYGLRDPIPELTGVQMGVWLGLGSVWVVEKLPKHDVGFVRIDPDSTGGDVSIFILPVYQGRGYGPLALKRLREVFPRTRALIRSDNARSRRAFEKAGYTFDKDQGDGIVVYRGA